MSDYHEYRSRQIPDDVREVLTDFTVSYLMEEPGDVVDFAVAFFTRVRETRRLLNQPSSSTAPSSELDKASMELDSIRTRTKSILAESYDLNSIFDGETPLLVYPKTDEQRSRLVMSIKTVQFFRQLDLEQMHEVVDGMFERQVLSGENVIARGDPGKYFYVIENGIYQVLAPDNSGSREKLLNTYEDGGNFGQLWLLHDKPCDTTIQALTNGTLWVMDRFTFRRVLLKSSLKRRKVNEVLLMGLPMLKNLTSSERAKLADALLPKSYVRGNRIFKQGDPADAVYFIQEGKVIITILGEKDRQVEIKRIGPGGYFGELALLINEPRPSSVFAVADMKIAYLSVRTFEKLIGPCLSLLRRNLDSYSSDLLNLLRPSSNAKSLRLKVMKRNP